ncbi:HET-domain-containing protein [Stipitochalara longipes BDJ]|nr:HET-domain-containing protein [Stipitochalara longipes BDJ]
MVSRFLNSALEQLSIGQSKSSNSAELQFPTLPFPLPPPAGTGTSSLCARCLTLLSRVITEFGDGTDYKSFEIPHSSSIPETSQKSVDSPKNASTCVICIKTLILFEDARAHVSFEQTLRKTPCKDWSLTWRITAPEPKGRDEVDVRLSVDHKGGYGWGIGGFKIYPDWTSAAATDQKKNFGDYSVIGPLDQVEGVSGEINFSSTLSPGTKALATSWSKECVSSHTKCRRVFGATGVGEPESWFPDRLIRINRTETGAITARLVLKSIPTDFSASKRTPISYLSLSHCWGPPPNASSPLGGRADSVLTESTLPAWQADLPLSSLPLTFQHAITICSWLDFEYIWIDSLCIMQDSKQDWEVQSAVMGDVYKYAFLNIAALSSKSDYEGFISTRDTRVVFGFRASFSRILNRDPNGKNTKGQECILLQGKAKLLWDFMNDTPGLNGFSAPLFTRAWVYQERNLARRTLAFDKSRVYWACDEGSRCEHPEWGVFQSQGLRNLLDSVLGPTSITQENNAEDLRMQINAFDMRWHGIVTSYTLCNLTKHTDKLMAISSIARELASTKIVNKRYLAGLWDVNLLFQLGWITVEGGKTSPRKRLEDDEYVAPSWSWASIDAPVQPNFIFPSSTTLIALADVRAADVTLATDYEFGSVKSGYIRLFGRFNNIKAAQRKALNSWDSKSTKLTDAATGETLWFCSDTVEGYEMIKSRKEVQKIVWMPLTLELSGTISCKCLVLIEVPVKQGGIVEKDSFVKRGEKVYRRLGTGNFGRIASMLQQDKLLLSLGAYPSTQVQDGQRGQLAKEFRRKEEGMHEFVLI